MDDKALKRQSTIDSAFSIISCGLVFIHLSLALVFGSNFISALPFYGSYLFIGVWYLILLVRLIIRIAKGGQGQAEVRSLFLSFGIICLAIVNVAISYATSNGAFSFDSIKKISSFLAALMMMHCISFSTPKKSSLFLFPLMSLLLTVVLTAILVLRFDSVFFGSNHTMLSFSLSNPNFAALLLLCLICLLLCGIFASKYFLLKIFYLFACLLDCFFLYLTSARGPLIALLLGVGLFFVLRKRKTPLSKWESLLLASIPFLVVLVYVPTLYILERFSVAGTNTLIGSGKAMDSRFQMWTMGFKQIMSNGPTTFLFGSYFAADSGNGVFHFHNSLLDTWVAYGFSVFLLVIVFFGLFLRHQYQPNSCLSQSVSFICLCIGVFSGLTESSPTATGSGLYILLFIPAIFCKFKSGFDPILSTNGDLASPTYNYRPVDVMIINSVYDFGSTGKIVAELKRELARQDIRCIALCGRKYKGNEIDVGKITTEFESKLSHLLCCLTGRPYSFNYFGTLRAIMLIKRYKPKVVHLHSFNDYYININLLMTFLKKHRIPTLLTLHSENAYIGNCGGLAFECEQWQRSPGCVNCPKNTKTKSPQKQWGRLFEAFHGFSQLEIAAVSPWLARRAEKSPIFEGKQIHVVKNGISPAFQYNETVPEVFKELTGKKIVFYVSADFDNPNKGGKFFLEVANHLLNRNDICFAIASLKPINVDFPKNVTLIPPINDVLVLSKLYSAADVTLITSKVETFSMPVAESLASGTPVCGFKAGGPESIALPKYCKFVSFGDVGALEKSILDSFDLKPMAPLISCEARQKYSIRRMVEKYENIYYRMSRGSKCFTNCYFTILKI